MGSSLRTSLLHLGSGPPTQPALHEWEEKRLVGKGLKLLLAAYLTSILRVCLLIHILLNVCFFKMAKYVKCLRYPVCSASVSTLLCVSRNVWRLLANWRAKITVNSSP